MKTRAELKTSVKQLFKGRWKDAILLCIVVSLLSVFSVAVQTNNSAHHSTSTSVTDTATISGAAQTLSNISWQTWAAITGVLAAGGLIALIYYCVVRIFMVGTSYSMLDWFRQPDREIHPVSDSTVGFTRRYALPTIGLILLQWLWITLWSLLLIVPGIIKYFAYSQTYFVYKDMLANTPAGQPKPRLRDAVTRSRQLMVGHKMEFFILQLSFIGWAIVCGLTAGIGLIWLVPYRYGTTAAYYQNLIESHH